MNKITRFFAAAVAVMACAASCHQPEVMLPETSRLGINSITASFMNDTRDENSFTSEIDYENGIITIVVPYTYPAKSLSHLEMEDLVKMRVVANVDDNVYITPSILYMDLSKDNVITVTDQVGNKKQYIVRAEIRKSAECAITDFNVPALGLAGVVNESAKTISIITADELGSQLAEVTTSFGATVSPDPSVTPIDLDSEPRLTVTAQNGTTKAVYTVIKAVPEKVDNGMRLSSDKILWQKKMPQDLGITTQNLTGGMAVTREFVVLNTRGEDLVKIDRKTGERIGEIALDYKGGLKNFYCTADDGDNILVTNLTPNDGSVFKAIKVDPYTGAQESFIEWDAAGLALGRKLSIRGSLDGNAVITVPVSGEGTDFFIWQVKNGKLVSMEPEKRTVGGGVGPWRTNCDVIFRSATETTGDYFVACYAEPRAHLWIDGQTNNIKHKTNHPEMNSNWILNAVDYVDFNGCGYVVMNSVNSFTWGANDLIYLYDLSSDDLSTRIWRNDPGMYGSMVVSGIANGNGTGDVALRVSENGYYMYMYFMFTNGYVVCVQYDCIKM